MTLQMLLYKIQLEYWSKDLSSKYLGAIIMEDFIMLCEKQLKSKILKTALKKKFNLHTHLLTCFLLAQSVLS